MATGKKKDPGRGSVRRHAPRRFEDALLRNEKRQKIIELLEQRPGMNKHQIAQELGLQVNTVIFHMGRLEEYGLVELRPAAIGRETLCFTKETVKLWDDENTRVLFGRAAPRSVALYLAENPGASVREAADALNLTAPTVRRHIRTLQDCDLVQRIRVDHQVFYHAEPQLRDWLKKMGKLQQEDLS